MKRADTITRRWIRNAADERAAAAGYRFDIERACWTIWWIERYCRLYEGEWAGEPLVLRAAYSMPMAATIDEWDAGDKKRSLRRIRDYMDCVDAGEPCDWQYECFARLHGWVRFSDRWKREVRRFNRGAIWVPKKNKKSPSMAAETLYLACGDGEAGQKVFLGAKDSTQLKKNVCLHIVQMIEQSPELRAVCKINRNELSVLHLPSSSLIIPLSSSNCRTQESKEGLNGSLLVDEAHVVDRDFIKRVDRTGISRSEPLFLQFSTAGKDPDSYGKEEFDRGVEVNAGRLKDDAYFFAYYGAEQTLTDEQLAADPAAILAAANPALGHTIDLDETLADYHRSKQRISDLADFKTYRLNIWQRSANPWIRGDDWEACGRAFTADDLAGRPCAGAFDLGQTDDMSALALVFPEDLGAWHEATAAVAEAIKEAAADKDTAEETKQPRGEAARRLLTQLEQPMALLAWFWLPEGALERHKPEADYEQWARDGYLRLTSGSTLDPDEILADMRAIFARFDLRMLGYDPWHGALLVGALQKDGDFPKDYCWGFKQTIGSYAFPSALFERMVISGKLHHDGNPILAWEAGHVQKAEDNNGNMRPVKPKGKRQKKVDGIQAAIMALDAATRVTGAACGRSIYEGEERIFFV
jgi:phage terminase large subunit-like protein